jgi:endonuclease/exonuclease/phosphatase family metal-dependent hydrolase
MKGLHFFSFLIIAVFLTTCEKNKDEKTGTTEQTVVSALKASTPSGTGTFTVLSYNVDGLPAILQGNDGDPETNTPIIGQKVRDYDIVNVQEDFNYHASLYANDNHPYRTATSGGAGIGSGLNTMSNFSFSDDIDRVTWTSSSSTDGNNLTPKGFTWLRLRISEGVYIDVYNLHTNAGSVDAAYTARKANITQLVTYILENSDGNAVLIFGDTNCRYTRSEDNIRNILTGTGALDSWVQLIKGGVAPTQGADALVCDDSVILTDFSCEVVDKIFYRSNNFITLTPLVYTLEDAKFRDSSGNMLSDHRPVYTKFQYTLASKLSFSDQFGGPHGTSYNDVNSVPSGPTVSSIGIRAGSRVDQVNLTLSNGTTFTHGGTGGTASSLALQSGEYISSVYMCSDKYDGHTRVFYIKFTTNLGRTLGGGTSTGTYTTYTAPSGWQIVGFHGRGGDEVDKLGVIYAPI